MKKAILNSRIDQSTKDALEYKCLEKGIPISQGAREAVEQYVMLNDSDFDKGGSTDLICTLSFTELIFWLLDKLRDPEVCEDESYYEQHMSLILEFQNDPYFDKDILNEFMKVYFELDELLNHDTHDYTNFKFPSVPNGFNYEKLHVFMHTLRFDDDNNKILFIK